MGTLLLAAGERVRLYAQPRHSCSVTMQLWATWQVCQDSTSISIAWQSPVMRSWQSSERAAKRILQAQSSSTWLPIFLVVPRGIKVNEYLQSVSNPAVYAAGDAVASGGPPLTPVAGYEGRIAAANLLAGNHRKTSYLGVPTVAFTIPPLASVGLSEHSAREQGLKFRTHREITSSWYSSRRVGEDCSGFKPLIENETDRVLGAHLLGPQAEELINVFALAISSNIRASDLREKIFAYPTVASDIRYML